RITECDDHVDLACYKLGQKVRKNIEATACPAPFELETAAEYISALLKAANQAFAVSAGIRYRRPAIEQADAIGLLAGLSRCRMRHDRNDTHQPQKISPPHGMPSRLSESR